MALSPESFPRVLVLGDVMLETFLLPTSDAKTKPPARYNRSDDYSAAEAMRIPSGAFLLRQMIANLYQVEIASETKPPQVGPLQDEYANRIATYDDLSSWPWDGLDLHTYAHQLGVFPQSDRTRANDRKVLRIASSLGLLRTWNFSREKSKPDETDKQGGKMANPEPDSFFGSKIEKLMDEENPKALPDIIIINDRGLAFRDESNKLKELFKKIDAIEPPGKRPLIIWLLYAPLPLEVDGTMAAEQPRHNDRNESGRNERIGSLYSYLKKYHDNTIVIVSDEGLRDSGIKLRFDMSFESTFDNFNASRRTPGHAFINQLLEFSHLLIRFDYGVMHCAKLPGHDKHQFDVHCRNSGGNRRSSAHYGFMTGGTFLLVAALVKYYIDYLRPLREGMPLPATGFLQQVTPPEPVPQAKSSNDLQKTEKEIRFDNIEGAIDLSLLLNVYNFHDGFGAHATLRTQPGEKKPSENVTRIANRYLTLFDRVFSKITKIDRSATESSQDERQSACSFTFSHDEPGEHRLARLLVPEDANTSTRVWSRVDRMPNLERDLQDIVISGLENVLGSGKVQDHKRFDEPSIRHPYVQVGNIVTVDRDEIDGFLSIKGLVEKYLERPEWKRPLSLVVFGPPGSGKGFTVKQILSGIRDIDCKRAMTINLSQFSNISELARVFHQVQDRALSGEIPLVFFDEFDSNFETELGWLKFFLAPMQDGQFFDANDVYNLGRSILVFAGGTVESYEKFVHDFSSRYELKVPDFISRLRGFVNISDISYKKGGKETLEKNDVTEVKRLKMRRAILLRSLLKEKMGSIFEMGTDKARIDPGIIHAFLEISEYKHGVRSMEAILEMSLVSDSSVRFDKSALPTEPQLNMHVDGKTFVDLVSRKRPAR